MTKKLSLVILQLVELETRAGPTSLSILGPTGINMLDMAGQSPVPLHGLTGNNVRVGQIERGRPGLAPPDSIVHPNVTPASVFDVDQIPGKDHPLIVKIDSFHATKVASVIKAAQLDPNDALSVGAARNSSLLSAAIDHLALPDDYAKRFKEIQDQQAGNPNFGVPEINDQISFENISKAITKLSAAPTPSAFNFSIRPPFLGPQPVKDGSSKYSLEPLSKPALT
jgi:hypothetical protein